MGEGSGGQRDWVVCLSGGRVTALRQDAESVQAFAFVRITAEAFWMVIPFAQLRVVVLFKITAMFTPR